MEKLGNIITAPCYKIEDRKLILERVYLRLVESPDCQMTFRGFDKTNSDNLSNWEARESICRALREL